MHIWHLSCVSSTFAEKILYFITNYVRGQAQGVLYISLYLLPPSLLPLFSLPLLCRPLTKGQEDLSVSRWKICWSKGIPSKYPTLKGMID